MKTLLLLIIVAVVAYAGVNFAPQDLKELVLGSTGIGAFFGETVPAYFREKLRISESPIEKRSKILDQLSQNLEVAREELSRAVPVPTNGIVPALPSNDEIRAHAKKAGEALAQSGRQLKDLSEANAEVSVFRTTALRAVDAIFPASTSTACVVK